MVWTSGSIGEFTEIENLEDKIKRFQYSREENGKQLKSKIQYKETILTESETIYNGQVFDEYFTTRRELTLDNEGNYKVEVKEDVKDIRYGYFWVTNNSIAVADSSRSREFVFRVISRAIGNSNDYVHAVNLDVEKIAEDYRNSWLGSIKDREGNWQSGVLYGNILEEDGVIGQEYSRCHKNQVGITTDFFGAPVKVRITSHGTVMILGNISGIGEYIRFIKTELMAYFKT